MTYKANLLEIAINTIPKYKCFLNWMQKFTIESSLKIYKKFKKSWINIVLIQQQIFSPIHFHWNLLCQFFFAFYLWYWFIDKLITQIWISCMRYIIIEYKRKHLKWDTKYIFKFYSRFVTAKMICNKIWHMRQMLYSTIFQSRNNVFHSNWKYYFMMRFPCILIWRFKVYVNLVLRSNIFLNLM